MNRIKRISMQFIEKYWDMFSDDFEKNKEVLNKVGIIRSKRLKNEIAGYITVYVKGHVQSKKEKEEEIEVAERRE
ncbi:MAG: 30S ribosomal protein S17e [Nitrososphaerales archaeon]